MKKQAPGEKEEFVVDSGGYVVDAAGEAERADSGRSEQRRAKRERKAAEPRVRLKAQLRLRARGIGIVA